ncbi:MAG: TRAM domain-containing protein [candidate division WOR-3 bacterium]
MLFKKEKVFVIDPFTIFDGRICDFLALGLVSGKFLAIEPQWEEKEDWMQKKAKENLERLKKTLGKNLSVVKGIKTNEEIIRLVKERKSCLLTADEELGADKNIPVVTIQRIFDCLKPAYLPGSLINVKIVKKGKDADEGIGYLEGGIKVIVDGGAKFIGREIEVSVLGSLNTSIGKVIFGKPKYSEVK